MRTVKGEHIKAMLKPVTMLKAEVIVHQAYIDPVLYSLGTHGLVEIEDIRPLLEADEELKDRVRPVEPSPLLFQLSSLSSRISALATTLSVPTSSRPPLTSEKRLDDATLKEISSFLDGFQEQASGLQAKIAELEKVEEKDIKAVKELSSTRESLRKVIDERGQQLLAYRDLVEPSLRLENVKTRMGKTESTFVFQGWIQNGDAQTFKELIEKTSEGNCFVSLSQPKAGQGEQHHEASRLDERPPTLLSNPRIAGVYQKLVSGFGTPNYFELDPSVLWLFTFPIIFGLMFGDLGQGAVLAILASVGYLFKRRGVKGGELTNYILEGTPLFIMSGIAATIAGWFYGECFGFHIGFAHEGAHETVLYLPGIVEMREGLLKSIEASSNPLQLFFKPGFYPLVEPYPRVLLKMAIYVGIFHISIGLVLSLVNRLRRHEFMEAFAGPITWLWLYLGGAYLFAKHGRDVFNQVFETQTLVTFIILPFVVMLLARMKTGGIEGFGEALDSLIASLSNTISYARIFAFSMIHAVLNSIFIQLGIIGALFGTLFFVFFEVVFVFFQALRLHWVEFGLKFFSGDGKAFKPFSTTTPS